MSQIRNVFLGAVLFGVPALSLMLGAMQFVSGRDLPGVTVVEQDQPADIVNRSAKSDRISVAKGTGLPTRTISMRHQDLADMSVLVRVPVSQQTREFRPLTPTAPGTRNRQPIACEPVVSVLTEVAKQLQPGRCLS